MPGNIVEAVDILFGSRVDAGLVLPGTPPGTAPAVAHPSVASVFAPAHPNRIPTRTVPVDYHWGSDLRSTCPAEDSRLLSAG